MPSPHRIFMLAFSDCQILDVTGPMQMFAGVNDERDRTEYELRIAAPARGPFATTSGVRLVANLAFADLHAEHFTASDTLIAAGGDAGVRAALATGELTALIRRAASLGARIGSVCTGAPSNTCAAFAPPSKSIPNRSMCATATFGHRPG